MVYTVRTTQNVVLYLSHRELILNVRVCIPKTFSLYLSHRELIQEAFVIHVRIVRKLYLSHRELILQAYVVNADCSLALPFP